MFKYDSIEAMKAEACCRALEFLKSRYSLSDEQVSALRDMHIIWGTRARFYHPWAGAKNPARHVPCVKVRHNPRRWHIYNRKTIGRVTPEGGIALPRLLLVTLDLIHEWTHAIQYGVCGGTRREASEVETTQNEIAYMEQVSPSTLALLVDA